jgi:hypothetical protein
MPRHLPLSPTLSAMTAGFRIVSGSRFDLAHEIGLRQRTCQIRPHAGEGAMEDAPG